MNRNHSCYTFQELRFESGFLDTSVDATYIITMEGGPRYNECIEKLKEYQPTKTVYILLNKGYKKCNKTLPKQNSMYDIIDANLHIFRHSLEQNYNNVLILEDDFIFNNSIVDTKVSHDVNSFLYSNTHTSFVYTLGCLPVYVMPYTFNTFRVVWGHAMHAVIYSNPFRRYLLEYTELNTIHDWDIDISRICLKQLNKYMYRYPLCYQTIPNTENKQTWGMSKPAEYILDTYIKATSFDTTPEPGTTFIYILANILFVITILLLLILIYVLYTVKPFTKITYGIKKYIPSKR